jgi:FAD/FMN-containing dehydrogenase
MLEYTRFDSTTAPSIDNIALAVLRAQMPGRVLLPSEAGYDAARAGFSLGNLPTPDVVVLVTSAAEVAAAVDFARDQQLPVGVKATGHNFGFRWPGGLMINTERMQGVTIDPFQRIARVEAGVKWMSVINAAYEYGLAPLSGSTSDVGVVGYTLSGGMGWMLRKYGAAVDSVIAAEIVTADGQLRRVSASSHPDLFWGLRGGGGNFGVVTALEFQLYPVSQLYGGNLIFPIERAQDVLATYSQLIERAPEELTSSFKLMRLPPSPELPELLRGRAVVVLGAAYLGTPADADKLLRPLRALGDVLLDSFRMLPTIALDAIANDPLHSPATRRTTLMLKSLDSATISALLDIAGADATNPVMLLEVRHLGGAMTRVAPETAAFSQRFAPLLFQTIDIAASPAQAAQAEQKAARVFAMLEPLATGGVLPSWLGDGDLGVERTRAAYTAGRYARLMQLKDVYDPDNLFRLSANNIPGTRSLVLVP